MDIELTRPDEIESLVRLARQARVFKDEHLAGIAEWANDYAAKGEASVYRFLSCRRASRLIGFACYGPRWLTQGTFDVYCICVAPGAQRQGAGGRLVWQAEKAMCELGGTLAIVEVPGTPVFEAARRFYQKHGYVQKAAIADFYAEGEAQVIYAKRLDRLAYGCLDIDVAYVERVKRLQKQALGYVVE